MKLRTVALLSVVGMASMTAGAFAIPLPVRESVLAEPLGAASNAEAAAPAALRESWHFTRAGTLSVDARVGHGRMVLGREGETYVLASITGGEAPKEAPPLNLAVVIDRSGSMAGSRMVNALAGAVHAVQRMREGDSVTIVSFDTQPKVVVPPTRITEAVKPQVIAAIRGIHLGGDTCISCGLETAMRELEKTTFHPDQVGRIILLSDGEPTHGVKDVPGFRVLAAAMRDKGFQVTTIGVDTQYEEKVMAAIATESDGNHFFVANPTGLPAVFSKEYDSLAASVATRGELAVEFAPGVEVVEVFDRAHRVESAAAGTRVVVPFGSFSAGQEKTLLVKVRLRAGSEPLAKVATMRLSYRDLVKHEDAECDGELAVAAVATGEEQKELDPFVSARVERMLTVRALGRANDLFSSGKADEAIAVVAAQQNKLVAAEKAALSSSKNAPAKLAGRALPKDFAEQNASLDQAQKNFDDARKAAKPKAGAPAQPPQQTPEGQRAVKGNAPVMRDLAF